jgi:hypothetical protein
LTPEQALLSLYLKTAARLRRQVRDALRSGQIGTAAYRHAQLRTIQAEIEQLGRRTRPLVVPAVLDSYTTGAHVVQISQALDTAAFAFTGLHTRAAAVIAENLTVKLDQARQLVGRRTDDAFRRVGLEVVGEVAVAAGDTRRATSREIERRLIDEGITDSLTGFVDRGGRRWQLDNYAEMVARTTTREAMSQGTANRMHDLALDLITISAHNTDCAICKPYEGNTYSLRGETRGYDVIDRLPPFHPHCWHVATPAGANLALIERALGLGIFTRD